MLHPDIVFLRSPVFLRGFLYGVFNYFSGNIYLGGFLYSFQTRGGVNFQHQRAAFALQHVYAGNAQPKCFGRLQRGFFFFSA